jgi:hypothetical protein
VCYRPLYDKDYETAAEEWLRGLDQWRAGTHEGQPSEFSRYFWEYEGTPDEETHRDRKWTEVEATHYQVYETVSEGTPVTPHFATKEELVEYLVKHGDFWDQQRGHGGWTRANAESFVERAWAPSLISEVSTAGVTIKAPRDGA